MFNSLINTFCCWINDSQINVLRKFRLYITHQIYFQSWIYIVNEEDVFLLPQNVRIDVSTSWNMWYKKYDSKTDESISVHLLRISLTKSERIIIVFKLKIKESFLKYYEVIQNGKEWSNLIKLYDRFDRIWSPDNTLRILPYYFSLTFVCL